MCAENRFPTNPFNDCHSSLVRPIKVLLPEGQEKGEDTTKEGFDDFVGRERLMERLYKWLSDKNKNSVSYLVTGFRGMGKTSLVNRVTDRLTREVKHAQEPLFLCLVLLPLIACGIAFAFGYFKLGIIDVTVTLTVSGLWLTLMFILGYCDRNWPKRQKRRLIHKYPNHGRFDKVHVDKMAQGRLDDSAEKKYNNLKIAINLGHEVLKERDVLSLIASSVRDKYKIFVKSHRPHIFSKSVVAVAVALLSIGTLLLMEQAISVKDVKTYKDPIEIHVRNIGNISQIQINVNVDDSWFSRLSYNVAFTLWNAYSLENWPRKVICFGLFAIVATLLGFFVELLFRLIPYFSTPKHALRRLDTLMERIVATTDLESGVSSSLSKSVFSVSLINRRKHKTFPIADVREIETELADIINAINGKSCLKEFRANFIVVFDEMDKIDPAMTDQPSNDTMPEFTDSVKGFPDGMNSRERRRNVLKLLANIKLFVSTAKAKFVFISGRELYDAYLADLSDRDFAISSIFSGVINVDSFLTPEGGQTDVRSMSEWYIANRLIPKEWLRKIEYANAEGRHKDEIDKHENRAVLKQERPSLRWYYEYLVTECANDPQDAAYVIGFLNTFAAYLTHISNGSPKKIFLYFDKYLRKSEDCMPMNDWGNVCVVGKEAKGQLALYFEPDQQKIINFVHYLSNPIMGTLTNDMSRYGDRFLVSLSFVIDHIYKHHNRSFSWRNMEQIPDLLKTNKAPELRDEVMSIMEYLIQIHISPILIGLNEYKFHKSVAEEISLMSKISDEASAIFNFTLDESLSVMQHNTRMLNHYIELDKSDRGKGLKERPYLPIIARIHSNLGDLHFWDEDYYAASLEYRAAMDALDQKDDNSGFLTRIRCMLKLGLTYEFRQLFPNAYQLYCELMDLLINKRWINEARFGSQPGNSSRGDGGGKLQIEEIRYVFQAILAKLSILEKMGMSGITQTNIDVAESEFRTIYKSVDIKKKFIISADFFRKLAEILYYKNSLTNSIQNQDSSCGTSLSSNVVVCDYHCHALRERGYRPPCYACKYYSRSLCVLVQNMFADKVVLENPLTRSYGVLKKSFMKDLLYTSVNHIRTLAQTLEGFGNVMLSCASGNDCEGEEYRTGKGITSGIIRMLMELCEASEDSELDVMERHEKKLKNLTRLDRSILYYWDAFRFYLIASCYHEAVGCQNKILNLLAYYVETVCYYGGDNALGWKDETETISLLIGDRMFEHSFIGMLFQRIARYTGYKYDHANLNEINELKWIYSRELFEDIDLTRMTLYPDIRSAWLWAVEIRTKGLFYLTEKRYFGYETEDYTDFIRRTYPLIAPQRRYETTTHEEVVGFYTKMRYNDHILNNMLGGHLMLNEDRTDYSPAYHVTFYEKLYEYLDSSVDRNRLDWLLYEVGEGVNRRLDLVEFLIHDTLVCITNMVRYFTPHNHLTSYSKTFVGLVYNYYWEWSRKYELLESLYQYQELRCDRRREEATAIENSIWGSSSIQNAGANDDLRARLHEAMEGCCRLMDRESVEDDAVDRYGKRSDRIYERLRHDIDDITINTIYSNYTAEMALKYYQMAAETSTEGEAYKDLIGSLHFLDDDLNNDTCQFNLALERFLLNSGVIDKQRQRLERLYKGSNAYNLRKAYIEGPNYLSKELVAHSRFDQSQFINSEY